MANLRVVETGIDAGVARYGAQAAAVLASRRLRNEVFATFVDGFGEPAWDMLLYLFVEAAKGRTLVPADELVEATPNDGEIVRVYIKWLASKSLTEGADNVCLAPSGRDLIIDYLRREANSKR